MMKTYLKQGYIILISLLFLSCEDFVEVDAPNYKIISQEVFLSEETAKSAMVGIYNQLFINSYSNGWNSSITVLSGLSADVMENIRMSNLSRVEFEQHELLPNNSDNLNLWSSAYNMIYLTNSFLEGLETSKNISDGTKFRLEGEARFVRAFTYFYLVNLYGDVPLVKSTDYRENELMARTPKTDVYQQIVSDLQMAIRVLNEEYEGGERTRVNRYAAQALLARVFLYLENWTMAEDLSSQVIAQQSKYNILPNLDDVFLANSKEAIWQISPMGLGAPSTNTNEGNVFIIHPVFSFFATVKLEENFVSCFSEQDRRLSHWIGFHSRLNAYYPFKYKIRNSSEFPIKEYSMVLRFAEQYLIRAEARAEAGNLDDAIEDLDLIRKRAGLDPIAETKPGIGKAALIQEILDERRRELFAEWGHRWLDLKRTGKAGEVLGADNPLWQDTDVLYPIPAEEQMKNPQLTQNPGY